MQSTPATDLQALKQRQQLTWSAGDYAVVGTTLQVVGATLVLPSEYLEVVITTRR
jgi:hypothetical protein